jgi:hypothetical protein
VEVTSTGSFGDLMRIEWGPDLGKCLYMRVPYVCINEGWVLVLPSGQDGPVELLISLEKKTINRLREDKEWTALATEYE